jgi:selenophosphate synthase
MVGKVPPKLMEKIVYKNLGIVDPDVLVGSAIGKDTAIIDLKGGRALIVTMMQIPVQASFSAGLQFT